MKTIFVQGSYDILNCGHCRSLKELYDLDGKVIVGLNSDELMMSHKGRVIIPFAQRKEILESIRWVDEVIEVNSLLALEYVKELKVDVFATVPEWEQRQRDAIDWVIEHGGVCYFLTYYPKDGVTLSSSAIRNRVIKGVK